MNGKKMRIEVHKFGGTSVGSAERIAAVAKWLASEPQGALVVVVSAMTGVTDALLQSAALAATGQVDRALEGIEKVQDRHQKALLLLAPKGEPQELAALEALTAGLSDMLRAVSWLHQLSPRTRDVLVSVGEKLSARLLALALRVQGKPALALEADQFLETNDQFGEALPLPGITEKSISAALLPLLHQGRIPVVTGFLGRAPDGATTTLGRGGSDYSATLLAGALGAEEVTIWTDVDGVFTANPSVVPEAQPLSQLNYREAAELSYYGAKVLHQRTIIPVASQGIPVRIRNSFSPKAPGTTVDGRFTPGSHPVKAISAVPGQALVSVEGKGMAGVPGIAARVFGALAEQQISITMISQSSSESSICFALPDRDAQQAELLLKRAFRKDLSSGDIDDIVVQRNVSLVAVVGLAMAQTPGVSGRLFSSLGKKGVNVLAIAQGSSELNISFAVEQQQEVDAVRAVHEGFGLHRLDTGEDTASRLDILLCGCGNIGRALIGLLGERRNHMFERFGLEPRIVGVCDRSGYVFEPNGLSKEALSELVGQKAQGKPLCALSIAQKSASPQALLRQALRYRLSRPVWVDVSDSDAAAELLSEAMQLGCDVVTANKKPLAGAFEEYQKLRQQAASWSRVLKAEATVGAGLPVIDTLEMMLAAGDRITSAQGCLSGTLAFVLWRLEAGARFSEAVLEAVSRGYTEPDPLVDLSGQDVARKALILARLAGLVEADTPVERKPLVDRALFGNEPGAWREKLATLDEPMAAELESARRQGRVLRYVATVRAGHVSVGPSLIERDSALGMLRGTDNMIVFHSERYDSRPLVVMGPGAGVEVTAMGVMGDILRIAAERK